VSEVIDHVGIRVSDLPTSRRMYEAALAELGFVILSEGEFEGDAHVLFGRADSDDFALHTVGSKPGRDRVTTGAHIAFCASDAGSVMRWHDAAVGHGGTDIGPPGVRPEYQRPLLRRVRPRS
jgi:catechol 2,3-dioxygenase-like lactoylglutathione lyase family enzyme